MYLLKMFWKVQEKKKFSHYSIFNTASWMFSEVLSTFFPMNVHRFFEKHVWGCTLHPIFQLKPSRGSRTLGRTVRPVPEEDGGQCCPQLFDARSGSCLGGWLQASDLRMFCVSGGSAFLLILA